MRAVIQRVKESSVTVDGVRISDIGKGLLVLLGVAENDTEEDARYLAKKIAHLRIFEDGNGKMNHSLLDVAGSMMIVSQFTLLGDCRKGRRPSFCSAAHPERAEALYTFFETQVRALGVHTALGQFRAMMEVALVNDGPVTLVIESKQERML